MTDFGALIQSLGEHAVDAIGKPNLEQLTVHGDVANESAEVEICLIDNTWDEQTRVIDLMIDLRLMFMDEISVSYRFTELDSCSAAVARRSQFAYA